MIKVLYLGHSRKWRGGENQVRLLIEGMKSYHSDVVIHIAYPEGALMIQRMTDKVDGVLQLPSTRPFDPRSIVAVVKYCKQHSIKILHAQSGNTHSLAYYVKFFIPDIKILVHRHVNFRIKNKFSTRKKYLSKKINHYIAISDIIKQRLVEYTIPNNKITVAKSTVNPAVYKNIDKTFSKAVYCDRYDIDPSLPLIGFAGALEPEKDPIVFVQTIGLLFQRGFKVNALIAGSGKLMHLIEQEINNLNLNQNIKQTGFIEDMPGLFSALDIFILPSKDEGLGTVLLEAIHAQVNVIGSDVGGIKEIINSRDIGYLVNPGDVDSFYLAVKDTLNSPGHSEQLRQNAIRHVEQEFNYLNMIHKNYQVYCSLTREP